MTTMTSEGWKHFTPDELIHSDTADRLCIDNTPTGDAIDNLDRLVTRVLDKLRDGWGRPIIVTSGYRCKELNAAVGGARNSQHLKGQAADIVSDDFDEFRRFVRRWCKDNDFDQCIFEHKSRREVDGRNVVSSDSEWIHISYVEGRNRRQMLDLNV